MTSEKRIRRAKHDKENPYYMAARSTAQDKSISYDALGLLNYVLSKPDDWDIQPVDLEREKCKRGKVYVILKELITSCYVERIYHRDDKHRITMVEYIAHEKPFTEKPLSEKQKVGKQNMGNRNSNTEHRRKQSTEDTKERESAGALHPLIQAWATVRGIDAVNIGAPVFSKSDLALAKRMMKWDVSPTCEEIASTIKASKTVKYEFRYLETDIPAYRLANIPKPATEPKRGKDGYTTLERAALIYSEIIGEVNHDGA